MTESTGERKGLGASRVGEPRVRVVAAVIRRAGRVLVARRPDGKRHAGLWEFPGGKVADGESARDALARELREELGVGLESHGPEICAFPDPGSEHSVHFHPVRILGSPRAIDHAELRWCDGEALASLDMAPADARVARFLVAELSGETHWGG